MATIYNEKMMAEMDGEFVVFLIGMRFNKPWKIHKWWPVFTAMPKMLKELAARPESGFLGAYQVIGLQGPLVIQYWRSFDHLEKYSRDRDRSHWPAWVHFNKKIGTASGDVGIWHETYVIKPGCYEAIYGAMPAFGLGKVGRFIPARGRRENARDRMGQPEPAGATPAAPL